MLLLSSKGWSEGTISTGATESSIDTPPRLSRQSAPSARLQDELDAYDRHQRALEEKRKTPEAKRERRRERRRGRAAVDDVLRAVDAGKK